MPVPRKHWSAAAVRLADAREKGLYPPVDPSVQLADYVRTIESGLDRGTVYRALIHDLPRRFHFCPAAKRRAFVDERPRLTGTRWDALLAAVAEHISRLHDMEPPPWTDEAERFLAPPWIIPRGKLMRAEAIVYSPGAFIRHGTLVDPLDLGFRGGEKYDWLPRGTRRP